MLAGERKDDFLCSLYATLLGNDILDFSVISTPTIRYSRSRRYGSHRPAHQGAPVKHFLNFKTLFVALTVGAAVYAVRSGQPTGRFLGLPYDFRVPTADRLRERLWNEDDERIFTPMVFGVGWSINLFRLVEKFQADNAVEECTDAGDLPPAPRSESQLPS